MRLAPSCLFVSSFLAALPVAAAAEPVEQYTALLADHVEDGVVDYPKLCADPRLAQVTDGYASSDPAAVEGPAAMALWINAYNAWTLKLVCDEWPIDSITDLHMGGRILGTVLNRTAWDRPIATVGGTTYTLNHVEHEILRKEYDDFRVHFALVCAAKSCPPLRDEAYTGDRLDAQLDDQGRVFLRNQARNQFDLATRSARISAIFKWFAEDFGGADAKVLAAIAPYAPEEAAASIQADAGAWSVAYLDYDWSLNGPTVR